MPFRLHHLLPRPQGPASRARAGFTLVELLVASVILAIVASGTILLLNRSNEQLRAGRTRNAQQGLVDQDLAAVLQANDRYSCSSLPTAGAAGSNCAVAGADPGESGYTPPPVVTSSFTGSGYERFLTLCNGATTANSLNTALITAINGIVAPAGITRAVATNSGPPPSNTHRYFVTWTDTATGAVLRRELLVPTVAGWCP